MSEKRLDVTIESVNEVYDGPGGILWEMLMGEQIHVGGEQETDILAQKAGVNAESHLLDVCSALGGPARQLAQTWGCRVTGLDATQRMHAEAISRTRQAGLHDKIEYKLGNALDMPFRAKTFDVVWGQDAWCYITDKKRLIEECARVLKPGGILAFTDWLETGSMANDEWQALYTFMVFPSMETLDGYATLAETAGAPGRFAVKIAQDGGAVVQEMVGAIVQTSGFTTYDVARLPELGGGLPGVVDQAGLEALAKAAQGKEFKRADGRGVQSVVFVQCAGQRDTTGIHLPYCSGHCCATSVKQAMYFKDANPDIDTVLLYTDLRLPGMGEDFYRSAQEKGVTFTKGKVSGVKADNGGCTVSFRDLILDENATVNADLVVLATGQVPNSGVNIEPPEEQQSEVKPISILNLTYRQGKDLPQLTAGLTDSHFICFPYETRRTGIYAAGPVRRPMDMQQAVEDATGAALKAIQTVENAALGRAAHPRSGDLSYPIVRLEGCTQCKRCTVECPFGAIDEDERRFPVFNEARCRRCGTCMGACPVRVISFENYSVDTVGSQIKSIDMPDEFSERPRILLLACENDAYPALDMAGLSRTVYSAFVRAIPVRCLGSVNAIWITDALNGGWDGVMMMGCKRGDDYQCHFVKGSELAYYRMSKIDDTLKGMGLETERVASYEVAITDNQKVAALINEYAAKIKEIGMSPMKGFN